MTYNQIRKLDQTEQQKFKTYTENRILDFDSFQKTDKKIFRNFLRNSREKAFPTVNSIYYGARVAHVCKTLESVPSSNNIVILADIEIFDDICAQI